MNDRVVTLVLILAVLLAGGAEAAKKAEPYAWPTLPDATTTAKASRMVSQTGLVVVDRQSHITIRSLGMEPYGIVRDEFVRLLVATEEGARRASIDLNDDTSARVTLVEGRTVAPDGTVTALDGDRDVERFEVTAAKKKRALASLAKVNFPAPVKGAILDLHFTTESDKLVLAYAQSMVFEGVPVVDSEFKVTMRSRVPGIGWSLVTLGLGRARVAPAPEVDTISARLSSYTPPSAEPVMLPSYHENMTLLAFMSLSSIRGVERKSGQSFHHGLQIDNYGCIRGDVLPTPEIAEYWKAFLKEVDEADSRFIRKDGNADRLGVAQAAPTGLPLVERLRALYELTQKTLAYNPDAEGVDTVAEVLKKGMADSDHGTMLFANLLGQARIPYKVALVANRYGLRFSPVVHNEYLYDFAKVVVVETGKDEQMYFMPGELSLPFGVLPDIYEESLALAYQSSGGVDVLFTPSNPMELDTTSYTYDLALNGDGEVTGKLSLAESGAPAWSFARWFAAREFRRTHPRRGQKKGDEPTAKAWQDQLDSVVKGEFVVPGSKPALDTLAVSKTPARGGEPLELTCAASGRGFTQSAGESQLVGVYPVMVGYENQFVSENRRTPIWYDSSGHVVVEGDLRLPEGATVIELPQAWQLEGPLGTKGSGSVEAREEAGVVVLHGRFEYDVPLIVPTDLYGAWREFQSSLARAAQDRAIVSMPVVKELE